MRRELRKHLQRFKAKVALAALKAARIIPTAENLQSTYP
jgi:hypothetical protein